MSELVVVGLSYRTAPVSVRERVALREEELQGAIAELGQGVALDEAVLISTCNRVELVAASPEPHRVSERLTHVFNGRLSPDRIDAHLYKHRN